MRFVNRESIDAAFLCLCDIEYTNKYEHYRWLSC